ncbi:MAG: amidohydrolase family protein [Treponema sp.]|nr:amidohydrolase family protein [Treponema sp.]
MKMCDFHVHITPPEIIDNWHKYAEKDAYFTLLSKSGANKFAKIEDVITMLDNSHFNEAVVFGFGFKDMGLCRMVNDYAIASINQYPDKITGFMVVPPNARGIEKEISRCHDAGLKGIGEIFPQGQGINIENKAETKKITGICIERNLPLILHANEPVGHYYPGKTSLGLKQIDQFIGNSQNLRIVLAHWGGGLFLYEAMPEIREKYRNVFYDTAATPFLYDDGIYRAALALGLCNKIIFGSDFPLLSPSRYMLSMEALPLPERKQILCGNAEKLLSP